MLSGDSALARSCESYGPAITEMTGTLFTVTAYGPPGYGEDSEADKLETVPVLRLDHSLCVDEAPADGGFSPAEKDVTAVQLVYSESGVKFRPHLVGRHVSVSGTLFHGASGHHRTVVLVAVTEQRDMPLISRAEVTDALAAAQAVGEAEGACQKHIGRRRASTLVALCTWVSSARHPPCNLRNPCEAPTEHIRQMCRHSAPDKPLPCADLGPPPEYARP